IVCNLKLGNGMTLASFLGDIVQLREQQHTFNRLLSTVDNVYNEMLAIEKRLAETSERMLSAVAGVYGRKSSEYEMAGGTRRPERRRSSPSAEEAQPVV
ncbi:MAG: hypothetical protein ACFB5Z_19610, partial [Elainellaceae cyanobacterium]